MPGIAQVPLGQHIEKDLLAIAFRLGVLEVIHSKGSPSVSSNYHPRIEF
jgi:hypothetical protein